MASKFFNSAFGLWKNLFYKSPLGSVAQLFDKSFTEDANIVVDSLGDGSTGIPLLDSYLAKTFDTGATGRDIELNKLNLQNQRESWSNNVQGMKDAGLNPALMYGSSSAGSAPALSNSSSGSLSDLLALATLPAQLRMLNAQAKNVDANTRYVEQKTLTEEQITRLQSIAAGFGYDLTSAQLEEAWTRIANNRADLDIKVSQKDLIDSQVEAQRITNKYLGRKLEAEIENLSESAKLSKARADFESIQANFARENGFLMSDNDSLMLATYIASLFGLDKNTFTDILSMPNEAIKRAWRVHQNRKKSSRYGGSR